MESIHLVLKELFEKYDKNEIIKEKIKHYICERLPVKLESFEQDLISRSNRKEYLNQISETFIYNFLNNQDQMFFFIPVSNLFIVYKNFHYSIINEDQILNEIFKEIRYEKELFPWKHKIKNNIMKKIRDNYLLNHIPESETIQHVLNIIMSDLKISKEYAKYILTIFGDNLLKSSNNIYFTHNEAKKWFDNISDFCFCFFKHSRNPISNIKFKYYHHEFSTCRLLDLNNYIFCQNGNFNLIKENILNILCVSAHYSSRFTNADNFLINYCNDDSIKEYSFYLKNNNKNDIVTNFKINYLENTMDEQLYITKSDMFFIWKKFLKQKKLPLILFSNEIEQYLELNFSKTNDMYIGITSRQLNKVKLFNNFWNKYMYHDEKEQDFKISEIIRIYNHKNPNSKLTEEYIVSIIEHFHNKEIVDNKYIHNISCLLWNKPKEIQEAVNSYKENKNISILDLYKYYCSYSKNKDFNYIVTKQYFEKYLREIIPENYLFNEYICSEYWDIV